MSPVLLLLCESWHIWSLTLHPHDNINSSFTTAVRTKKPYVCRPTLLAFTKTLIKQIGTTVSNFCVWKKTDYGLLGIVQQMKIEASVSQVCELSL